MAKTLIFGHKNPDTDTICSAVAYADLKKQLGEDVEAVRLGVVNEETQYALNHFQVDAPRLVESVAGEVQQVILVDQVCVCVSLCQRLVRRCDRRSHGRSSHVPAH